MSRLLQRLKDLLRTPDARRLPYESRGTLLTTNEARFFHVLRRAVGDKYVICAKVRLGNVVTCPADSWAAGYGPPISYKHVDFVLCDPKDDRLLIHLVIELTNPRYETGRTRQRDAFVDRILTECGIPVLRVRMGTSYNTEQVQQQIAERILGGPTA